MEWLAMAERRPPVAFIARHQVLGVTRIQLGDVRCPTTGCADPWKQQRGVGIAGTLSPSLHVSTSNRCGSAGCTWYGFDLGDRMHP